jgi:DNA-3-methyladenine glycosylase II
MVKLAPLVTTASAHIAAADPRLAALIAETGPLNLSRRLEAAPDDHFGALTACLIGQRQSERDTIRQLAVFRQRFGKPFPTPQEMLSIPQTDLAILLMSHRKAGYLHGLAADLEAGRVQLDDLCQLDDAAAAERLLAIKGVGQWSVEQILFWHLERPDVLVTGDPAVRRAYVAAFSLSAYPAKDVVVRIGAPWGPYRSFVAHLLLQSRFGPGESAEWPRRGRPNQSTRRPPAADG